MSRRTVIRPVLQSSQKLEYHVDDNEDKIPEISDFLIKSGKKRIDKLKEKLCGDLSLSQPQTSSNNYTITIGLRQTLKLFNKKELKWIILDADVIKPSAVGNVFGLLAINSSTNVKFYVVKNLSSSLNITLNIPRVSAVGFGADCPLDSLFGFMEPIEIVSKTKLKTTSATSFVMPELKIPAGKYTQGISKKQQRKLAAKNKKK